ncbi:hypothetical protein OIO90_000766 [Microbotryomycetes sp. JL221]|nr:hypothetical protein OIO90_000766 [Microbotryomycetes sp. JL221]
MSAPPVPPQAVNKPLSKQEKYEIITQNLDEVLGQDILTKVLDERDLVCYWGTAPTGRPHLGYFVPLTKIADFLSAGVKVKVLLADVHAFLDNLKAPIELVERRANYYKLLISAVFKSLHLPLDQLEFVLGSTYQYTPEYNLDKYKLCSITTEHDARKAGAEVVKQVTSPVLSGLLYPLLQALDEEYLKVDFQFGGVDQRKIFTFAEANLPKLGYAKRAHLMNKMVPGLSGGKMSSSDPNSKIDFLDSPQQVKSKIQKAHCAPGEVEGNGVLAFVRNVIVPIGELMKKQGRSSERRWASTDEAVFTIKGDPKHGGETVNFNSAETLEQDYLDNKVHPGDLKSAVVEAINALLEPIQKEFNESKEFQEIEQAAYPPEKKEVTKKKEKKFVSKEEYLARKAASEQQQNGAAQEVNTDSLKTAIEDVAKAV